MVPKLLVNHRSTNNQSDNINLSRNQETFRRAVAQKLAISSFISKETFGQQIKTYTTQYFQQSHRDRGPKPIRIVRGSLLSYFSNTFNYRQRYQSLFAPTFPIDLKTRFDCIVTLLSQIDCAIVYKLNNKEKYNMRWRYYVYLVAITILLNAR